MDTALCGIQRLHGGTPLPRIVSRTIRATDRKMAGYCFDRPSLHPGTHAGYLRAELMGLSPRHPRALDRLGVADAEDREPVGIGLVSRRRRLVDHLAHLQQFRCRVMQTIAGMFEPEISIGPVGPLKRHGSATGNCLVTRLIGITRNIHATHTELSFPC